MALNILYFHQSADLYGSDKTLLELVLQISKNGYSPIVLLPSSGPLYDALQSSGVECHIVPVLKISRSIFCAKGIISIAKDFCTFVSKIDKVVQGRPIHLVHSNTLAVFGGAWWAARKGIKHLWHVHEIIEHPSAFSHLFPLLLRVFADKVICNSSATKDWVLSKQPNLRNRLKVILNGIEKPTCSDLETINTFAAKFRSNSTEVVIGMVGRLNRWKGQSLLIDAFNELYLEGMENISLIIVGGPPAGQNHYLSELQKKINLSPAKEKIHHIHFMENIWPLWETIDIAVVPSTEPEPFGLVAIEAMAASKPVVAAAHGGLIEIVSEGKSGLLFEPKSKNALISALKELVLNPEMRTKFGDEGKNLQNLLFSRQAYVKAFAYEYLNH